MATQIEDITDDDHLEDNPELDLDADDQDEGQDDDQSDEGEPDDQPAGDDEDVITFGDAGVSGEDEPEGMRNLRQRLREVERENRTLKGQPRQEEVGPRPSLEQFDYDEDAHAEAVVKWVQAKRDADDHAEQQEQIARKAQEKWERQSRDFEDRWSDLRIAGKDAARARVEEAFDATQQALLVKAARGNAAGLFAAIGFNADNLAKLKTLTDDPAEFIAEAAVMAKEVKVERKPKTTPIEPVRGGTGGVAKGDARRAAMEAQADKSGDYSALIRYDFEQKRKKANG